MLEFVVKDPPSVRALTFVHLEGLRVAHEQLLAGLDVARGDEVQATAVLDGDHVGNALVPGQPRHISHQGHPVVLRKRAQSFSSKRRTAQITEICHEDIIFQLMSS